MAWARRADRPGCISANAEDIHGADGWKKIADRWLQPGGRSGEAAGPGERHQLLPAAVLDLGVLQRRTDLAQHSRHPGVTVRAEPAPRGWLEVNDGL